MGQMMDKCCGLTEEKDDAKYTTDAIQYGDNNTHDEMENLRNKTKTDNQETERNVVDKKNEIDTTIDKQSVNNDDIKTVDDEWNDDWDDEDDVDDLNDLNKTDIPGPTNIEQRTSIPPTLGAYNSHNKLNEFDEADAQITEFVFFDKCDKPSNFAHPERNYGGLVLYQYDGQTEWNLNGIYCKAGLILLKDSNSLPESSVGQIHGGIFKTVFNESVSAKVVASGFAYYNKKWVFKSRAFNLEGNDHVMRDSEAEWLKKALQNYCDHGLQKTKIEPPLNIYIQEKGPYIPKKI